MKYDKLKQLVGKSVSISPHPTMGMEPTKPVSVNTVPTKSVPVNAVPTKSVPVNAVPTRSVPTNNVPTFKNTEIQVVTNDVKRLITSVEIDSTIDKAILDSLSKSEKLLYVANRGWRLSTEVRGNQVYDYAVKYINRKKHRIYLGKTEI